MASVMGQITDGIKMDHPLGIVGGFVGGFIDGTGAVLSHTGMGIKRVGQGAKHTVFMCKCVDGQ